MSEDEAQRVGLSRRGMLQAGALGIGGGFLGAAGYNFVAPFLSRLSGGFKNSYSLRFGVHMFADETQAKEKLPGNLNHLVENGAYMGVGAQALEFDRIQIYHGWHSELPSDEYGAHYTKRIIGESEFALIVTSPSLKGTERFTYLTKFLDNKSIFDLIIQGVLNEGDRNQFKRFKDSYNRSRGVGRNGPIVPDDQSYPPQKASFTLTGDSVSYSVDGLEFLTGGDKDKLQREWRDRMLLIKAKA